MSITEFMYITECTFIEKFRLCLMHITEMCAYYRTYMYYKLLVYCKIYEYDRMDACITACECIDRILV